ncbi:MAG: alpha/beta fold hydrolase [Candidatus Helarchaeota archaeon]
MGHFIKINNVKLYYEEYGNPNNETIIMLHGWNENRNVFKYQIEEFSKYYRVITIDMRGHGKSSKPRTGYSYTFMAKDLYHFLKKLEINNPIIIGHSMGGQIALKYYLRFDNCKKLVLISSPSTMPIQLFGAIKLGQEYLTKKLRAGLRYASETFLKNFLSSQGTDNQQISQKDIKLDFKDFQVPLYVTIGITFNALSFNVQEKLDQIKIPVLILAGVKDDLIPISEFEFMAEKIPNCKLIKFPDCGHFSFIEKPAKINQIILDFLKN